MTRFIAGADMGAGDNSGDSYSLCSGRLALAAALLTALAACGAEQTPDRGAAARQADIAAAQAAAGELGQRLKGRLVATLSEAGPVAAIRVCAEEAPAIAADVSAEHGFTVGRTSLRVRNPGNSPDARERAVLELWQLQVDKGVPAAALEPFASHDGDFLWMKPIVAEGPCLMCHGTAIPEDVASAIALRYPQDEATGFAAGDLRGAFVVRR